MGLTDDVHAQESGEQHYLEDRADTLRSEPFFRAAQWEAIKFQMASAAEWCQLDTVTFVAELENLNQLENGTASAHPLTLLGIPQVMIQELRILINGVVVECVLMFAPSCKIYGAVPSDTTISSAI